VSEYWNGTFTVLSVQITEEQFYKMKAQIEHDQINGDHTYQASNDPYDIESLLTFYISCSMAIVHVMLNRLLLLLVLIFHLLFLL
jgi:hypothetical protein